MNREYIPKWVAFETTRRCNLDCIHCRCSSDPAAPFGAFTLERALALIDEIAAFVQPVFVLSGGEPLLRPDIFDIARHATAKGFRTCMATNGLLVTEEVCAAMKESGIKMVAISLDGPNREVHDSFRRVKGAFDGAVRAAKLLRAAGIPFLVNSSFGKANQAHVADTFRLAKSLGAVAWYMFMVVPSGRGEEMLDGLIRQPDYDELLEWHLEQERREEDILMRPTCAPHYYRLVLKKGHGFKRKELSFATGASKGCVAAQTICLIDAFGEVRPCSYISLSGGNVLKEPFRKIWEESPLFLALRDTSAYKGRCGVCEYRNVCGGCRVRALALRGDVLEEDPFCDHVPVKLRRC